MTVNELKTKLRKESIPKDMYSLEVELPNEAYCVNYNSNTGFWEMYYSERGEKTGLKKFENEEIAYDEFYSWIKSVSN